MAISLQTITFDRTISGRAAAWSVPVNSGSTGVSTDWQRSGTQVSSNAVAYSLSRLVAPSGAATLTVTAETTQPLTNIHLRATPITGQLKTTPALVNTGKGKFTFKVSLPIADLSASGTHEWKERWLWEQSTDQKNWVAFDETSHTVFVLPDDPGISWNLKSPRPAQQPWQAVLSLVCGWADGANDVGDAAARITESVYALGGKTVWNNNKRETIQYDPGSTHYNIANQFAVEDFLRLARLHRNPTSTMFNCLDGAGAVVVLSNALGCRLNLVRLCPSNGADTFRTTIVLRAGATTAHAETFAVHATAVSSNTDRCWDSCIKVDLDGKSPLDLVTNHPLNANKDSYVIRLASPPPNVVGPQTVVAKESGDFPQDREFCPLSAARLRSLLAGTHWSEPSDEAIETIRTAFHDAAGWTRARTLTVRERSYRQLSGVLNNDDGQDVTIDIWQAVTPADAVELVLDLALTSSAEMTRVAEFTERIIGNDEIGEYLLIWGRLVIRVRHASGLPGLNQVLQQIASSLIR